MTRYSQSLFNTWANITLDAETIKMLLDEVDEMEDARFDPNDPNTVWLEALAKVLSRAGGVFKTALPDFDEVTQSFSSFPVLLVVLASRSGDFELLPVYVTARLLARANLAELARYEGRAVPMKLDDIVSEQEAALCRSSGAKSSAPSAPAS